MCNAADTPCSVCVIEKASVNAEYDAGKGAIKMQQGITMKIRNMYCEVGRRGRSCPLHGKTKGEIFPYGKQVKNNNHAMDLMMLMGKQIYYQRTRRRAKQTKYHARHQEKMDLW